MRVPADLQCFVLHNMPYAYLPENAASYPSMWVELPNAHFDPVKGHALYRRYMSEMVLAEKLGFDGLMVNEHHSTISNMMPATGMMAAALIAQTSKARIGVFGTPVNLEYPNRLAEEYAMLDVLSGGRLEVAFPLGTGMEYWSNASQINPATARARFKEGMELVVRAWTEDGPLRHDGEFYNYRYLNVWPKPYQKPHPPVYVVGSGSEDTLEFAASHGYGYSMVFVPIAAQLQAFAHYREVSARHGHEVTPDKLFIGVLAYLAETEAEAQARGRVYIERFLTQYVRTTPRFLAPPGYISVDEFRKRISGGRGGVPDWQGLCRSSRIICGTPDMAVEAIERWVEDAGCSRINLQLHFSDQPHWETVRTMTLFAEQVLPRLRSRSREAVA